MHSELFLSRQTAFSPIV